MQADGREPDRWHAGCGRKGRSRKDRAAAPAAPWHGRRNPSRHLRGTWVPVAARTFPLLPPTQDRMHRPSSLQVVTAAFVVVLLTVVVTFVVLALRSDRLGDRSPGITNPSLTTPDGASPSSVTANRQLSLADTP